MKNEESYELVKVAREMDQSLYQGEDAIFFSLTGRPYSAFNHCFLIVQGLQEREGIILLGGNRQWEAEGRVIKEEEKDNYFLIWVPSKRRKKVSQAYKERTFSEDEKKERLKQFHYFLVKVWARYQTEEKSTITPQSVS